MGGSEGAHMAFLKGSLGVSVGAKGEGLGAWVAWPGAPTSAGNAVSSNRSFPNRFSSQPLMQNEAERNSKLLSQILPPHILLCLMGGKRVLVEKLPDV